MSLSAGRFQSNCRQRKHDRFCRSDIVQHRYFQSPPIDIENMVNFGVLNIILALQSTDYYCLIELPNCIRHCFSFRWRWSCWSENNRNNFHQHAGIDLKQKTTISILWLIPHWVPRRQIHGVWRNVCGRLFNFQRNILKLSYVKRKADLRIWTRPVTVNS